MIGIITCLSTSHWLKTNGYQKKNFFLFDLKLFSNDSLQISKFISVISVGDIISGYTDSTEEKPLCTSQLSALLSVNLSVQCQINNKTNITRLK